MIKLHCEGTRYIFSGNTFPLRDRIKKLGFKWAPKQKQWDTLGLTMDKLQEIKNSFSPEELEIDSSVQDIKDVGEVEKYNAIKKQYPNLLSFRLNVSYLDRTKTCLWLTIWV